MEEIRGLGARSGGAEASQAYSTPVKGHASSSGGMVGVGHWAGAGQKFTVEGAIFVLRRLSCSLVSYDQYPASPLLLPCFFFPVFLVFLMRWFFFIPARTDLDRLDGRELARLVMYAEEESSRLNALESKYHLHPLKEVF